MTLVSMQELLQDIRDLAHADERTKTCRRCKREKPLTDFSRHDDAAEGRHPRCRECLAAVKKRRYGPKHLLTPAQRQDFIAAHGGACQVCGGTTDLNVDHDHATGALRGVLCGSHNRALGLLKDDPEQILALYRYLAQAQAEMHTSDYRLGTDPEAAV